MGPTVALLLLLAAAVCADVKPGHVQPACPAAPGPGAKSAAHRLHHALFCAYDPTILPVADPTKNISVSITIWIRNINMNEYDHNSLEVNSWFVLEWNDDYLAWDPSVYEEIMEVKVPPEKIWTPYFIKADAYQGPSLAHHKPSEVCVVDHDGHVQCMWAASFSVVCHLQYDLWPFDSQYCKFALMAANDNSSRINMTVFHFGKTVRSWFLLNPEWELVNAEVEQKPTPCLLCQRGIYWPSIQFELLLERRSAVYVAGVTIPAIGAALMTLLPYLLQPTLPQRSLLAATGILAHVTAMQLLASIIYGPAGTAVPPVVLLYRDSLVLCALSLAVSVLHRWLTTTSPDPPPALKDASSRLLDLWARNLSFVRLQMQDSPAQPEKPAADFWQRWTNLVDGCVLITSIVTYVILWARFLP